MKMDKQAWLSLMQELPQNVFTGGGKTDRSLVTKDNEQIDVSGYPVESGYEFFEGGVAVREGIIGEPSKLLYREDAMCVGPYNFKTYHEGRFDSPDQVAEYLAEKYKDKDFDVTKKFLQPDYNEDVPRVWDDKKYANELARQEKFNSYSRYTPEDQARLVWQDKGVVTQPNGQTGHAVVFAYACDEKTIGKDAGMPNPYLKNTRLKNGSMGHTMSLSDDLFNRLQEVSGPGGGQWNGCVNALLDTKTFPDGKKMVFPDLSGIAREAGFLSAPETPFDVTKHDRFVKASVKERAQARDLPKAPEESAEAQLMESQMGE